MYTHIPVLDLIDEQILYFEWLCCHCYHDTCYKVICYFGVSDLKTSL